jgi:hypothetical protein
MGTRRFTPAMQAKITDHIWTVRELLEGGVIRLGWFPIWLCPPTPQI